MVARDDDDGGGLADLVQIGAGLYKFGVCALLGKVARDRNRVWREFHHAPLQRIKLLGYRRPAKVQVRGVQNPDHERRVYLNVELRETLRHTTLAPLRRWCRPFF
jgi:hypothetical protein